MGRYKTRRPATPVPHLREARERRGWGVRELERVSGVPRQTLIDLEHVRRGAYPSTIEKLATALGVPPIFLTGINPWELSEEELECLRRVIEVA